MWRWPSLSELFRGVLVTCVFSQKLIYVKKRVVLWIHPTENNRLCECKNIMTWLAKTVKTLKAGNRAHVIQGQMTANNLTFTLPGKRKGFVAWKHLCRTAHSPSDTTVCLLQRTKLSGCAITLPNDLNWLREYHKYWRGAVLSLSNSNFSWVTYLLSLLPYQHPPYLLYR